MDEKNFLHRDDVPMEVAEGLVEHLKALYDGDGPVKVQFIGDLTDGEKSKLPQEMLDNLDRINDHLIKCYTDGLCHVCGVKFPGEWPPTDESLDQQGWVSYVTVSESEEPPMFACPSCEETDSDGQSRPVEIPEIPKEKIMAKLTRNDPIVFHFRLGKGKDMEPKAGVTVVFLPELKRFGIALCCYRDRYNRRRGREIATVRARGDSRIRSRRFDCARDYTGPLEMDSIRASAQALAYLAADKVENPFVRQGSFFINDDEKNALKNVGISKDIVDLSNE